MREGSCMRWKSHVTVCMFVWVRICTSVPIIMRMYLYALLRLYMLHECCLCATKIACFMHVCAGLYIYMCVFLYPLVIAQQDVFKVCVKKQALTFWLQPKTQAPKQSPQIKTFLLWFSSPCRLQGIWNLSHLLSPHSTESPRAQFRLMLEETLVVFSFITLLPLCQNNYRGSGKGIICQAVRHLASSSKTHTSCSV